MVLLSGHIQHGQTLCDASPVLWLKVFLISTTFLLPSHPQNLVQKSVVRPPKLGPACLANKPTRRGSQFLPDGSAVLGSPEEAAQPPASPCSEGKFSVPGREGLGAERAARARRTQALGQQWDWGG